jgi:hypothetical protein
MLLPFLLLPLLSTVLAKQYTLHHRYTNSGSGYTQYGTIEIPESETASDGVVRIEQIASGAATAIEHGGEGWYQVQLTGEGQGGGLISSTKAVSPNANANANDRADGNSVTSIPGLSHLSYINPILEGYLQST